MDCRAFFKRDTTSFSRGSARDDFRMTFVMDFRFFTPVLSEQTLSLELTHLYDNDRSRLIDIYPLKRTSHVASCLLLS